MIRKKLIRKSKTNARKNFKKQLKVKKKPLLKSKKKRIASIRDSHERTPPIKYLETVKKHLLFGDLLLFDSPDDTEYMKKGLLSIYNYTKNIKEIIIDNLKNQLTLIFTERDSNLNQNWRLLVDRLKSLSNTDAKRLADVIQPYCEEIETQMPPGAKARVRHGEAFSCEWEEIITCVKLHLEKSKEIMEDQMNKGYYWRSIRITDRKTRLSKLIGIQIDSLLLELAGHSLESFSFITLREGIPEIFSSQQYFNFWSRCPVFHKLEGDLHSNTPLDIVCRNGKIVPSSVKELSHFSQDFENVCVTSLLVNMDFNKAIIENCERAKRSCNNHNLLDTMTESTFDYKKMLQNFHDKFYNQPGLIPMNLRTENTAKVCGYKLLKDLSLDE